ncbi:MAG TPA: hypothetical protein VL282_03830 [Tepidisphaeraceae bacterium]|nr:hypothetical protein [Tepidisphaeraceae bacterium]
MKLRQIKTWQWLLAGVAMGVALAWLHAGNQTFGDGSWRPGINQSQFESLLRMTKLPHAPQIFKNLTIYPTIDNKTYVCGEYLINLSDPKRFAKFEMFTTNNARALLKSKYPAVSYTYAWWRDARVERAFWLAFPVCLIGAICPMLIRAFGSMRDLPPQPVATTEPPAPPAAPSFELPEPEPLQKTIAPEPQVAAPAVAALSSEPLEPAPIAGQEEEKNFKGEFYPVARNVLRKH